MVAQWLHCEIADDTLNQIPDGQSVARWLRRKDTVCCPISKSRWPMVARWLRCEILDDALNQIPDGPSGCAWVAP